MARMSGRALPPRLPDRVGLLQGREWQTGKQASRRLQREVHRVVREWGNL